MYRYVLVSEDDKDQEYAEQFPDMVRLVPYKDNNGYDEQICLIEFDDIDDFDYFQARMFKCGNRIEIEGNDSKDNTAFWTASEGCPIMTIDDRHYTIDEDAWAELLRINRGE